MTSLSTKKCEIKYIILAKTKHSMGECMVDRIINNSLMFFKLPDCCFIPFVVDQSHVFNLFLLSKINHEMQSTQSIDFNISTNEIL